MALEALPPAGRDQAVPLASSPVDHDLVVDHDGEGRADFNQGDHVQVAQVVFHQTDHDRVVPHSNVRAPRLNLLPADNDLGAEVRAIDPANPVRVARRDLLPVSNDLAAEARPISSLAVSSICRAIATLVAKVPSLIADRSDLALRGLEGPMKASGSPNDVTVCPTGVRNRSRTEQTG